MSGGILALFGVVLAAAIADILLPGKEKTGLRRALNVLVSLTVLLLILQPVMGLIRQNGSFFEGEIPSFESERDAFEKIFDTTVSRRSAAELEQGVAALLERDFGISNEDCTVHVTLDEDGTLLRVSVRLSGKGLLVEPAKIEAYLIELLNCHVEVR